MVNIFPLLTAKGAIGGLAHVEASHGACQCHSQTVSFEEMPALLKLCLDTKLVQECDVAEVYFNSKILGYEFENKAIKNVSRCAFRLYEGYESMLLI